MQLQNHSLTFVYKAKTPFSATSFLSCSPMAYNNTAPLYKLVLPSMWTLANVKTGLDIFFGPRTIPATWMQNSKFSRNMTVVRV